LEQVLESRSDLARILLIASDTKESLADISIRLDRVAEGIDVLTIAEGTRKSEQITKENQKKITDKLLGSTDVAQKSTTTCNDCWVSSMKNSGEWLNSLQKNPTPIHFFLLPGIQTLANHSCRRSLFINCNLPVAEQRKHQREHPSWLTISSPRKLRKVPRIRGPPRRH
jgi:hypothetical protein